MNNATEQCVKYLLRQQEKVLEEALKKRLGLQDYSSEELRSVLQESFTGRLEQYTYKSEPGVVSYHLDGEELVRFYPEEWSFTANDEGHFIKGCFKYLGS